MPPYAFRGSSEQTYTGVPLANGDAIDAAVGDAPGDSAVRDAAVGDAAAGDAAVGDAAVGDAAPLLDWSLDFIEGAVSLLVVVSLNFLLCKKICILDLSIRTIHYIYSLADLVTRLIDGLRNLG